MNIKILSHFEVMVECNLIENCSDTLVIILPGIGYTCHRALLDYSKRLACDMGFDVLPMEYGFQAARKPMINSHEFNIVVRETKEILMKALGNRYKRLIFIGKSIGTLIQASLQDEFADFDIKNIYLTPISETVKLGIKEDSLVVAGNADPMIKPKDMHKLRTNNRISFMEVAKADHGLNIKGDAIRSIDILSMVIKKEKEYLRTWL